jgi:hypothetical protein
MADTDSNRQSRDVSRACPRRYLEPGISPLAGCVLGVSNDL